MSIFDTPLYKESIALQRVQARETQEALKDCRSYDDQTQTIRAYARKHWAEQDCLGQRHGLKPMLWPIDGGLPIFDPSK